ncbi:flavodoxin family protein [Thermodesulfobacteriota bacterium]
MKCTYEDEGFEWVSDKILNCGALILGTPVYWWDASGWIKYLILKMFRLYARKAPLQGLPALGIAIAGGTGNGLISGLRQVHHFFQVMQMRAIEPLPSTRFNFDATLKRAGELGEQIAQMADQRHPFNGLEDRLLWYDALPYINLSRAEERRLLAGLAIRSKTSAENAETAFDLAKADELKAAGKSLDALVEITRVYDKGVKSFGG